MLIEDILRICKYEKHNFNKLWNVYHLANQGR